MLFHRWGALAAATLAFSAASAASAQEAPAATSPATPAPAAAGSDPAPAGAFDAAAITETDLGKVTGREDTATLAAISSQRNTVSNNSVTGNSVTGGIQIDGNAFQNLQGLAVISANSGNNVAINSSMNVTINMAPQ